MDPPPPLRIPFSQLTPDERARAIKEFGKDYVDIVGYVHPKTGERVAPKASLNQARTEEYKARMKLVQQQQKATDALLQYEESKARGEPPASRGRKAIKAAGQDLVRSVRQGKLIQAEARRRKEAREFEAFEHREEQLEGRGRIIAEHAQGPVEMATYQHNLNVARIQREVNRLAEYEQIMQRVQPPTAYSLTQLEQTRAELDQNRAVIAELEERKTARIGRVSTIEASLQRKGRDLGQV